METIKFRLARLKLLIAAYCINHGIPSGFSRLGRQNQHETFGTTKEYEIRTKD